MPEVQPGDDLPSLLAAAAPGVADGDILVVAQKVVSKAEGRLRPLAGVEPGERALTFAREHGKDARLVQVVFDESAELLRAERGVLICVTHHGFVCANAGVDVSNAPPDTAVLLPTDPDESARAVRRAFVKRIGVIVSDTFGRPLRAIACECERSTDPNLSQALHLMNGDLINRKLAQPDGRLAKMLRDPKLTDETLVQTLYGLTFNRPGKSEDLTTTCRPCPRNATRSDRRRRTRSSRLEAAERPRPLPRIANRALSEW